MNCILKYIQITSVCDSRHIYGHVIINYIIVVFYNLLIYL